MRSTALLFALFFAAAAQAQVVLVETPPEIVGLLKPHLPAEEIKSEADKKRLQRQLKQEWPDILSTEGYFQPELVFGQQGEALTVVIKPGPRTLIRSVDISIEGGLDANRKQALLESWSLQKGMPFRQADWSRAKQQLLLQLLSTDFRAATLQDSRVDIDVVAQTADLKLVYNTGPAYHFGPLRIEGLQRYDADLIARYNHVVKPNAAYSETAVTSLQGALQGSGYFSSVQIETKPEEAIEDEMGRLLLPVHLYLREKQPHRVTFGAGASSNTGARIEVAYSTTDLGSRAWKWNTGMRLEEKKQTLYSDIFLPPAYGRYQPSIGMAIEKTDIENLQTDRRAISLQRTHQRGSVAAKLSLNWQLEDKMPEGAPETKSKALAADGQWTWHKLDSILNPRSGQVVQTKLAVASQALLSDRDFARTFARYQLYLPIGQRDTLGVRAEMGYTFAGGRDGIPEEYLFRAGGTNSVRGYAYNSLGVRSGEAIVGGRYLMTASIEYTHWIDEQWGAAFFVDAGNAGDNFDALTPKYGAGTGVRWRSPAGPIAVDLAMGQDSNTPRLHFFLVIPF